ncbi:MAG: hypothetical protein PHS57_10235 [Alphaproteobacteria bacterium]|nr:hypothetical protein [Alphaproteobacteria bacterium]
MGLPCRLHFALSEVSSRWGASMTDLRYYLENGLVEAHVIISPKTADVYQWIPSVDGRMAWFKKGTETIDGYVVVDPEELRKIFRFNPAPIRKFRAVASTDYYKLVREKEISPVGVNDLWVSKDVCEKFEAKHQLTPISTASSLARGSKTGIPATSPGRPSVMNHIVQRYQERLTAGETLQTLTAEAKFLRQWAKQTMPGMQIPYAKTILNRLSALG